LLQPHPKSPPAPYLGHGHVDVAIHITVDVKPDSDAMLGQRFRDALDLVLRIPLVREHHMGNAFGCRASEDEREKWYRGITRAKRRGKSKQGTANVRPWRQLPMLTFTGCARSNGRLQLKVSRVVAGRNFPTAA
jgi:hypothetical protein